MSSKYKIYFRVLLVALFFLFTGCSGETSSFERVDNFKTEYYVDEIIDYSSAKLVLGLDSEGRPIKVNLEEDMVTDLDVSRVGDRKFTVTYDGNKFLVNYKVKDLPEDFNAVSIRLDGEIVENYYVGDEINLNNAKLIVEFIENNQTIKLVKEVKKEMISGFDTSTAGQRVFSLSFGSKALTRAYYVKKYIQTITYSLDGGTNNSENPTSFAIDEEVVLKDPTKQGYKFLGWYLVGSGGTLEKITKIEKGTTRNVHVFARWELAQGGDDSGGSNVPTPPTDPGEPEQPDPSEPEKPDDSNVPATKKNISFIVDGVVYKTILQTEGERIEFPKKNNKVYEWFFDKAMTKPCTGDYYIKNSLLSNVSLYGKEAVNKHIMFNGVRSIISTLKWNWSEPLTLMDIQYGYKKLPVGYHDVAWYTDDSLDEQYRVYTTDDFLALNMPSHSTSVMIYSKDEKTVYDINYVMNGGTNNGGNPAEYSYGDNFTFLEPTKPGYIFDGWYRTSTFKEKIVNTKGLFLELTLYAKFITQSEGKIPNEYENPNFETGKIVTDIIETEHFIIKFRDYAYMPPWFLGYLEETYDLLELVTGLNFDKKNKMTIEVHQSPEHSRDGGTEGGVGGTIPASWGTGIYLTKQEFLGDTDTIIHELAHCLQYQQQNSNGKGAPIVEGFAQYASYKVLKYLEKNPAKYDYYYYGRSSQTVYNLTFFNISSLYSKPFDQWLRVGVGRDANGDYAAGFAFMAYLDEVYGSYTKWTQYDTEYDTEIMISNIKKAYGNSVFSNFYGWLRQNATRLFDVGYNDVMDYSASDKLYFYPLFLSRTSCELRYFKYKDLYLDIDEIRNYLVNYKGKSDENLRMDFSERVQVVTFDVNGNVLMKYSDVNTISLVRVSYVLLVGENTINSVKVDGFN